MFQIKEKYVKVTSEHSALKIEKKAKKVLNLLKKGIKFTPTQPNIDLIIEKLRILMNKKLYLYCRYNF